LETGSFTTQDDLLIIGPTTGVFELNPMHIRCNDKETN